jgi:hypothetical protein
MPVFFLTGARFYHVKGQGIPYGFRCKTRLSYPCLDYSYSPRTFQS